MELREYLRLASERWLSIAACALLSLVAAGVVSANITPLYEAHAQLFVSVQASRSSVSDLAQGSLFTQQRVKSYAALATSPRVLSPVIRELGLSTSVATLAKQVSADAPLDTVLIDVAVKDNSPARAAAIANAVSSTMAQVVGELERPPGQLDSPVKVSQTQAADEPRSPVSPNLPLNLALALLLGLSVGVGSAVLRHSLDTRVRGAADLERMGAPALVGAIVSSRGDSQIKLTHNPRDVRAETFRQLRTNLQFIEVDEPPRCIVLTSALPGEGKTTVACNLAVSLAQAGHTVALVDGDLRRPQIGSQFGLDSSAGVTNVLIGQAQLSDVLQPIGDHRLFVLASGPTPPNPSELLGSHSMNQLLKDLRSRFDFVLVDTPPLLPVTDAAVLTKLADGALIVVQANTTRREQLARSLNALTTVDGRVLGTVLNRVASRGRDSYSYGYYYYARRDAGLPADGPASRGRGPLARLGKALGLTDDPQNPAPTAGAGTRARHDSSSRHGQRAQAGHGGSGPGADQAKARLRPDSVTVLPLVEPGQQSAEPANDPRSEISQRR